MFEDFKTEIKLFFIVAVIAVIIATGGILLLEQFSPTIVDPPPPSDEQSINNQQSALNTSTWQTYRNDEYGFEINYPREWIDTIEHKNNESRTIYSLFSETTREYAKGIKQYEVAVNGPYGKAFDIYVLENARRLSLVDWLRDYVDVKDYRVKTVDGQTIFIYPFDDLPAWFFAFAQPEKSGIIVLISLYDVDLSPESTDSILFDQILSTFRFIEPVDTSDWQTYRNDEFGFEVRYPKDWTTKEKWGSNFEPSVVSLINPNSAKLYLESADIDIYVYNLEEIDSANLLLYLDNNEQGLYGVEEVNVGPYNGYGAWVPGHDTAYSIFLEYDQFIYELHLESTFEQSDITSAEKQILSTFRFVE